MTNREFREIMKNASDKTLGELSGAAPLTKREKDRMFRWTMEKLHEKEQASGAAVHGLLPEDSPEEIIPETVSSQAEEQVQEESMEAPRITRSFGPMIAIAASMVIAVGSAGVLFLNSNRGIDTDLSSSASSSSVKEAVTSSVTADSKASSEGEVQVSPLESADDSRDESSETADDSQGEVIQVTPDESSEEGNESTEPAPDDSTEQGSESTPAVTDDKPSSSPDPSSSEQEPAEDSSEAQPPETDSGAVDMDDLRLQLKDSIDALNTQTAIAKGEYADTTVWYDEDFNVTDDRDKLVYYPIPEEYREQCENLGMTLYSGHFTGSFIRSMGLDEAPDRFVEHGGTLYFKAAQYTAHRPTYYVLLNDEIHMNGNDSFHVEVTDGQGIYDLSFVYETTITVYNSLWKINAMTYERSYN